MLQSNWCHQTIVGDDAMLGLTSTGFVYAEKRATCVPVRAFHFHKECLELLLFQLGTELSSPHEREIPDPADLAALDGIPVYRDCEAVPEPDGPRRIALVFHRYLNPSSQGRYALAKAGMRTLLDVSHRTREEIAAIRGVGPTTLKRLDEAMAGRGLTFRSTTTEAAA